MPKASELEINGTALKASMNYLDGINNKIEALETATDNNPKESEIKEGSGSSYNPEEDRNGSGQRFAAEHSRDEVLNVNKIKDDDAASRGKYEDFVTSLIRDRSNEKKRARVLPPNSDLMQTYEKR